MLRHRSILISLPSFVYGQLFVLTAATIGTNYKLNLPKTIWIYATVLFARSSSARVRPSPHPTCHSGARRRGRPLHEKRRCRQENEKAPASRTYFFFELRPSSDINVNGTGGLTEACRRDGDYLASSRRASLWTNWFPVMHKVTIKAVQSSEGAWLILRVYFKFSMSATLRGKMASK